VQAITLIEADKGRRISTMPAGRITKQNGLPQIYQSLGMIDFYAGDKQKAQASFEKATQLDPSDVNGWILLASIHNDEYQALATKFNVLSAGAERDEMLKRANEKMDQVIEMYARIVALTEGRPEARQINEQVRRNWKATTNTGIKIRKVCRP
jgi:tetratricopeptide (TPR) repeat protein